MFSFTREVHQGSRAAALPLAAALVIAGCGSEPVATGGAEQAVTLPPLPTALALDATDVAPVGACSPWRVATVRTGAAGAALGTSPILDTPVDLAASGGATLYLDAGCATPLGGALTVAATGFTAPFWVRATSPTAGAITASAAGLDDASATYEIAELGAPAGVAITVAAVAPVDACVPVTVRLIDGNGFRVVTAASQDVELGAGSGSYYAEATCTSGIGYGPIRTIAPGRGSLRVWTRALEGNDYRSARLPAQAAWTSAALAGRRATRLALAGPAVLGPGQCKAITVKTTDDAGLAAPVVTDLPVALGGAGAGAFYADRLCSDEQPITGTTITAGRSSRAVYVKAPMNEELTLTATGLGAGASLPLVVAAPTRLAVTGDPLIASGTVGAFTVRLQALVGTRYVEVAADHDVTVRLTHTGDGTICGLADCGPATEIVAWTMPAGATRFTFYVRHATPPTGGAQVVTLAAADESGALAAGSLDVAVIAPTLPAGLRLATPAGASPYAGRCVAIDATVVDAAGGVVATPAAMAVRLTGGATDVYTTDTCTSRIASRTVTIAPGGDRARFFVKDPAIEAVTLTATGRYTVAGLGLTARGTTPLATRGALAITGGLFAPLSEVHEGLCQSATLEVHDGSALPIAAHPDLTAALALPPNGVAFAGASCDGEPTTTVAVPAGQGAVTFSVRLPLVLVADWNAVLRATSSSPLLDPAGTAVHVRRLTFLVAPAGPRFVGPGELVVLRAMGTWSDGLQLDLTSDAKTTWRPGGQALTQAGPGQYWTAGAGWFADARVEYAPVPGSSAHSYASVLVGAPGEATAVAAASLTVGATTAASYRGTWRSPDGLFPDHVIDHLAATWSSDAPDVATVDAATGTVTAIAPGVATITGTFQGVAAATPITVTGPPVIALSPTTLVVPQGGAAAFAAATAAGADVTAAAAWSTSDPSVATVVGGTVTGVAVGTAVITATLGPATVSRPVTVTPPAVASLSIAPIGRLVVGAAAPLVVTATYSDGSMADVSAQVDWSSASPTVAWAATASARVVGRTRGATTLTAAFGGRTAAVAVEVWGLAVTGVVPVMVNGQAQLTATVTAPTGATTDVTATSTWAIECNPGGACPYATMAGPGLVRGVSAGAVMVRVTPGAPFVGSWPAPLPIVTTPPAPPSPPTTLIAMRLVADDLGALASPMIAGRGEVFRVRALGTFLTNGVSTVVELTEPLANTWYSAVPATVTALGAGWFAAVAAPSPDAGVEIGAIAGTMRATARVRTVASPVVSVAVAPDYLKLPAGARVGYQALARARDGTVTDVTATATWSSPAAGIAVVDATGQVDAVGAGTAALAATWSGVTGTARVDVIARGVVWATPVDEEVSVVGRGSHACELIALLDDGVLLDLTRAAAWTSRDPTVATVGTAPADRGLARGTLVATETTTTIVGTVLGLDVSGDVDLTVRPAVVTALALTSQYADARTMNLTATASWSDGGPPTVVAADTVTWTSSNPAVAVVLAPGVVSLVSGTGQATITATRDGGSGTIVVQAMGM